MANGRFIAPVTENKDGQDVDLVNSVRRATSYGLTQLAVESTDYAFVTGCSTDHCNSRFSSSLMHFWRRRSNVAVIIVRIVF